jgi:tRNA (cytidine/uridine-2'-O-)-methyltransferase
VKILNEPVLHIVLDRPRIAANIASIVRMATGTCCVVHVCGPLVFDKSDKTKWRAGLDYFYGARVHFHLSVERCLQLLGKDPWIIEVGSQKAPWDVQFVAGDVVVLGPESDSVDQKVQDKFKDRILTLPQIGPVRSLNLAQCAAVVAFEATRQARSSGAGPGQRTHAPLQHPS